MNTVDFMRKYADLISETASQQDLADIEAQDREHEIGNDYDEVQEMRRLSGVELDEGILDGLKNMFADLAQKVPGIGKLSATILELPGFAQAYSKAQKLAPQISQIAKSASSGKEAVEKVKQLASGISAQQAPAQQAPAQQAPAQQAPAPSGNQMTEGAGFTLIQMMATSQLYMLAVKAFDWGPATLVPFLMVVLAIGFLGFVNRDVDE
jgi:hypothetical protein